MGYPHTCKVFANGRMLLHLAPSLIEHIKEIDAMTLIQSKASYEDCWNVVFQFLDL
jgi:hypothetical protein